MLPGGRICEGAIAVSALSRWILLAAALGAALVLALVLVGALAGPAWTAAAEQYFDPDFLSRARAYNRGRYLLFALGQALTLGLLALGVARGWHRQVAAAIEGMVGPRPLLAVALFTALLLFALRAAGLPVGLARLALDHRYGLSTQPLGLWLSDWLKGLAVEAAVLIPLVTGLFWLVRRWPQGWWLPASGGLALYLVAASSLGPVVVDPLFHRFTPLQDPALAGEVRDLARRAGVPADEVLVMDASRRTRRVNAYFAGVGRTRRIVLYDTLLSAYDRRQVLLVLAHELGHWRLGHIRRGLGLGILGGAAGLWLAQRLLAGAGPRPGDPSQVAVLTLFFLLASLAVLPVQNLVSRAFEREADRFAIALTGDPAGMAALEERLGRDNLGDVDPHPFIRAVLFTHPPVVERMEAALRSP
nr:MAG: endopeptidase [Bacillota bacterium]